jgi:hypothetical protein
MPEAVAAAYQVVDLWEENQRLRHELARSEKYEKLYNDEIMAGVRHGEKMMGSWLELLLSGRMDTATDGEKQ